MRWLLLILALFANTGLADAPTRTANDFALLVAINAQVNRSITYTSDLEQYGAGEKWVMDPASKRGDCEDYALTKQLYLARAGVPLSRMQVSSIWVPSRGMWHAVLLVRDLGGEVWVLDNAREAVITRTRAAAKGYVFFW